jgi:TonB family protein
MKTILLTLLIPAIGFSSDWIAALDQARAAMNHGEFVNAEQILNSTIDQAQAKSGHNSTVLDQPLEMLAQVYQREKRFTDAAATQQWRIDIWTALAGENGVVVGRVLHQLSAAELQAGNLPGAEADSRRALAIMTAAFVDKPPAAQAAADLADVLIAENRNDEAEQMLALAEKTFATSLGSASMLATGIATRRAAVLRKLGRTAEAEQLATAPKLAVYRVGGTGQNKVVAPHIESKVEPQYAEEARKGKLQGSIQLSLVVDVTGAPTQIAILHPLGMGLDEKAIEAISQWKFTPGTKNGAPVPVYTQVEMTFHLL